MKTNNKTMTNLTNTELQAAIDSMADSKVGSTGYDHCKALIAEQIRRLNLPMVKPVKLIGLDENFNEVSETLNPPKIQPAVEEWEYVIFCTDGNCQPLHKMTYKPLSLRHFSNGRDYGVYKRLASSSGVWRLITDSEGILPETVEEIN